tara:strand:- start:209 stop:403 length:195 start_codon:yes stop_codon:yes gene_type:complete
MVINQKRMKVKAVEELRKYIIDKIKSADDPSLITKTYEICSGNLVAREAEIDGSEETFVYVYEY